MKIVKAIFWITFDLFVFTALVLTLKPFVAYDLSASAAESVYYETKTFSISAYYSPLPCQYKYATGSYEGDIKLNGSGVNSADGTPVYPGMIAAPKSYDFGTKIYIPDVGITAVHDRGGAIVNTPGSEIDGYLDIWMGYGDTGLTRALNWGRRTVDVTIYGVNDDLTENVQLDGYDPNEKLSNDCTFEQPTVSLAEASVEEAYIYEDDIVVVEPDISAPSINEQIEQDLTFGDEGPSVLALQEELGRLNYFKGEKTGVYDELTEHAVFKFQQSQLLVGDVESLGAGVFGPKTRDRMNEIIASRNFTMVAIVEANMWRDLQHEDEVNPPVQVAFSSGVSDIVVLTSELDFGVVSSDVSVLQSVLKDAGFYGGSLITDYYGPVTKQAVLDFQIANNIVSDSGDLGAGRVGPSTLEALNQLYT